MYSTLSFFEFTESRCGTIFPALDFVAHEHTFSDGRHTWNHLLHHILELLNWPHYLVFSHNSGMQHAAMFYGEHLNIVQLNTIKRHIVKHILNPGSGELSSIQQLCITVTQSVYCVPWAVCASPPVAKSCMVWLCVCLSLVFRMTTSQGSLVVHSFVLVYILCSSADFAHRRSSALFISGQ